MKLLLSTVAAIVLSLPHIGSAVKSLNVKSDTNAKVVTNASESTTVNSNDRDQTLDGNVITKVDAEIQEEMTTGDKLIPQVQVNGSSNVALSNDLSIGLLK